jgi:rubrerythrin
MPLDTERKKLCEEIDAAIKDEEQAVTDYKKMESKFNQSDNPAVRTLGIAVWTVSKDEEKHKTVMENLKRLLCPTF